jgi:hypothetical protein
MERGEVDGACATYDTLLAVKSDWLRDEKLTFLAQFGSQPVPGLERVPIALDRIKNPADREAMELILSQQITGRPYVAPPDVPPDRLAALRAAFDATMLDPAYLADAQRVGLMVDPLASGQFKALLDMAYMARPETVDHARQLIARANRK